MLFNFQNMDVWLSTFALLAYKLDFFITTYNYLLRNVSNFILIAKLLQ